MMENTLAGERCWPLTSIHWHDWMVGAAAEAAVSCCVISLHSSGNTTAETHKSPSKALWILAWLTQSSLAWYLLHSTPISRQGINLATMLRRNISFAANHLQKIQGERKTIQVHSSRCYNVLWRWSLARSCQQLHQHLSTRLDLIQDWTFYFSCM